MATFFRGYHTELADTPIVERIPRQPFKIPQVDEFRYENDIVEHTAAIMRVVGVTRTSRYTPSGTNDIHVASLDPGKTTTGVDDNIGVGDYFAWEDEFGVLRVDTVSATTATNAITPDNALPTDIPFGARVYYFHEFNRSTHIQLRLKASATTKMNGPITAGFTEQVSAKAPARRGVGEPILFVVDNVGNAGKLHYLKVSYVEPTSFR